MASVNTASILAASWQRCREDYHLDPNGALPHLRLSASEIRQRLERTLDQVELGTSAMVHMRKVVRDTGYSVLFADRFGAIVKDFCDSETALRLRGKGLAQGSMWDEAVVGTNGIGTTLVERRGTCVIGADHYHTRLKGFVCVSTPMIGPDGAMFGVLTLAGDAGIRASEAMLLNRLARDSAGWIEMALFRNRFQRHFIVALAQAPDIDGHVLQSLLAVDDSGFVVGASTGALQMLGLKREQVLHQKVSTLLGVKLRVLEARPGHAQRLDRQGGDACYAFAFPNERHRGVTIAASSDTAALAARPEAVRPAGPDKQAELSLEDLAGGEPRMQRNVDLVRRVADSDLPLLLQGETGTGKEAFARAIHRFSSRRERPFVAVNCAAIPESLLDSELFGYAPGTFTGGLKQGKTGKILAANGGTLFLDEIGDMKLDLQTRLLRVLSEREVTPLGAVEPVPVTLNLICATHRDLEALVAAGNFRQDLYYRIHGARLVLSPLRERADLGELILSLAEDQPRSAGPLTLSEAALEQLLAYPWPGNIRQLSNVLRLLALTCDNGLVRSDDLPEEIRPARSSVSAGLRRAKDVTDADAAFASLRGTADLAQRARILQALRESNWVVSDAARQLGISRATLHRRMKDYDLTRPAF